MSFYPHSMTGGANQQQQPPQLSPPIPLANYQPHLYTTLPSAHLLAMPHLHSSASSSASGPSSASFLSASSFAFPASGREQPQPFLAAAPAPHSLSSSSLDHAEVYRGMHVQREPTMFQQAPQAAHWQQQDYSAFLAAPTKKLDLPSLSGVVPATAMAGGATPTSPIEVPLVPSHVERFTSFYSHAVPAVITKALRMAFRTLTQLRVDCNEETNLAKFRGVCYTEDGDSIQFIARVWRTASSAPAPYLVELQRRYGDSVAFFRLYQKVVKACAHVHSAPFESSFMDRPASTAPLSFSVPQCLPLPGAAPSVCMDLPTVTSLCHMAASQCVDTQREGAKCLMQVTRVSADFPELPSLKRASSLGSPSAEAPAAPTASDALWSALSSLLSSRDGECARLGASILRSCLRSERSHSAGLLERLERDPALLHSLVATLEAGADDAQHAECDESTPPMESLCRRESRRQVAAVLAALAQRKGAAVLHAVAPNAQALVQQFHSNAL